MKEVQKCVGRRSHPPRLLRASEEFEAGWLIVQVQWYHYEKEHDRSNPSTRAYRLKPEKKWIVVNALLFIKGLGFETDPQQRSLRSGSTDLKHFSMDSHNSIMNCMASPSAAA